MNKQEIKETKFRLKNNAKKLSKYIFFGGLGCLSWSATMLLTISIIIDPKNGIEIFLIINKLLYQTYALLVVLWIFILFLEYIIKKKLNDNPKIIVKNPTNNNKKD